MSTDIKLSKAQLSKIIQSGVFLGTFLSKLALPLMRVCASLVKFFLAPLATMVSSSAIDGAIKKNVWNRYCKRRKSNHFSHFK